MRLTLRTLLAYMDGELERLYPQEAKEIGKRIEDSKTATDLYHKIRDVMRRLRLAAPSITEKGANLDCNTVAEYLDNELPDDRVPDFEEVCLKSEMHLAEVASCHQILAVAQVEPAEVEPESRQRMYQLPEVASRVDEESLAAAEAAKALSGDGSAHAAAPPTPPVKARPRPVVPEYLRDPPKKHGLLRAAAITLLACAAIALVLVLTGQTKPGTPIGSFLDKVEAVFTNKPVAKGDEQSGKRTSGDDSAKSSGNQASTNSSGSGASPSNSASSADSAGPAAPASIRVSGAHDTGAPPLPSAAASSGATPAEKPVPPAEAIPENPDAGPPPLPRVPATSATVPSAVGPSTVGPATSAPATIAPPQNASPITRPASDHNLPIVPANSPKANIAPAPGEGPTIPGSPPPPPRPLTSPNPASAPPAGPNEVARLGGTGPRTNPPAADKARVANYVSAGQDVLLKYDAANSIWQRVLPEEFLTPNQPLLTLPSYRSQINIFDVGATIELFNGTRIEILRAGAEAPLGVDISYGRLIVKPLAQAGARLRVVAGAHTGLLTLANVESIAAFEVTRSHVPGTDPEKDLSRAMTRFYVAKGSASWEENGRPVVRLNGPAGVALDGGPTAPSSDVPRWISTNTVNELDQRAALAVSQALPAERSATLALNELAEDRRKEVRYLAARCLGYLGQFDSLVLALDDPDFRVAWPDYYDELKEAIARGPETAAAIRQSLEKKFTNDAPALYRMLWGYTDRDLQGGEDTRLVKYLDSEVLAYRVLAFSNLREITHEGLYYRPEAPAAKRQQPVQRWKQEQQIGKIRWTPAASKPTTPKPRTPPVTTPAPASPPSNPPGEDTTSSNIDQTSALEPIGSPTDGPTARPASPSRPSPSQPRPKLVYPEPVP
jgi:hypothetical protein